jgi:hypothetical protein
VQHAPWLPSGWNLPEGVLEGVEVVLARYHEGMQPEIGVCRLAPRKIARQQQEVQCSVEQAGYNSLEKDRHFLLGCGPGGGGNGTELAIAETKTRDAYSGRVAQNAGGGMDKIVGKRKGKFWRAQGQRVGFIEYGPHAPDDINANGVGTRGDI